MKGLHGLLWSSRVFLMKLFPSTQCPQTLELSASSANHSLLLASFLATCGQCLVWERRFLSSKSWSGCSCFSNMHPWCLAKAGARATRMGPYVGLLVLRGATFNLALLLGPCCCSLSPSDHWQSAARNGQEVEINVIEGWWVIPAGSSMPTMSLRPIVLRCWRYHYWWSKNSLFWSLLSHLGKTGLLRNVHWLFAVGKFLAEQWPLLHRGHFHSEQLNNSPEQRQEWKSTRDFSSLLHPITGSCSGLPFVSPFPEHLALWRFLGVLTILAKKEKLGQQNYSLQSNKPMFSPPPTKLLFSSPPFLFLPSPTPLLLRQHRCQSSFLSLTEKPKFHYLEGNLGL